MVDGGAGLTYNPANNSLIMATNKSERQLVELSIPVPKKESSITMLNIAGVLQPPANITAGSWDCLGEGGSVVSNGGYPGGFLVYNNKLIGSAYAYYSESAVLSHFTASLQWSDQNYEFSGFKRLGINPTGSGSNAGYVGGYMAIVPDEWRSALGYPALTGQCCISIITRTSLGPAVSGFDPDDIGVHDPSDAKWFVVYPYEYPALGTYGGTSLYFNMATKINGVVFPSGSNSVLFFGTHGLGITGEGDTCYGNGVSDISLHGTLDDNGVMNCFDPVKSDKGGHGYPYIYRFGPMMPMICWLSRTVPRNHGMSRHMHVGS